MQTEAKLELIILTGWHGGARKVAVVIFRLVPENKEVGDSIQ